jgi:hypothetical protein
MRAHYEERFQIYGLLAEAMKPLWQRMDASRLGR